ncbi:MAG TPA: tetratricopeptide repeat protein [Candidatus Limnocylindria bacterium]|nr:tetratricopeptide repeat protein [Candidatus Limnocylindria bacterium]
MKQALRLLALAILGVTIAACTGGTPSASTQAPPNETAIDALNRGLELHRAGKLYEATVAYFQSLAKEPANQFAFYNLGLIAQQTQKTTIAESYYRIALDIDPKFASPLYNLAILRHNAGAYTEVVSLYRRLLEIEPSNANAHYNLALALRALGQRTDADAEFARARQLDSRLVPPTGSESPRPTATR